MHQLPGCLIRPVRRMKRIKTFIHEIYIPMDSISMPDPDF